MTHLSNFGYPTVEREEEIARRRQFIERMEQKLRFKESAYLNQHNQLTKFLAG